MQKFSEDEIILGTRTKGVIIYNKKLSTFIKPENFEKVDKFMNEYSFYDGIRLSSNTFLYSTLGGGLLQFDMQGNIINRINRTCGLNEDIVWALFEDRQQSVWLGTDSGISHVELNSGFETVNPIYDFESGINSLVKQNDIFYYGIMSNLIYQKDGKFGVIEGLSNGAGIWQIIEVKADSIFDNDFILVSSDNLYKVFGFTAQPLIEAIPGDAVFSIYRSKIYPRRFYISSYDGVRSIYYQDGKWINEGFIKGVSYEIRIVQEDKYGNIWIASAFDGIFRVENYLNKAGFPNEEYIVKKFGEAENMKPTGFPVISEYNSDLIFCTEKGSYKYNYEKNIFDIANIFVDESFVNKCLIIKDLNDKAAIVYSVNDKKNYFATKGEDGKMTCDKIFFNRIPKTELFTESGIYVDESNTTWFAGSEGLFSVASTRTKNINSNYNSVIIACKVAKDSVIYHGNENTPIFFDSKNQKHKTSLDYNNNSIIVSFGSLSFDDINENLHSYKLEGFDEEWSSWAKKTEKEYTNLREGEYTFIVKSKNVYGVIGQESKFNFEVKPPIYRTAIAYIVYVLLFILIAYLIYRKMKILLANKQAEIDEKQRLLTMEIEMTEKLKAADKLKDQFLANTSHELRTPLNGIIGLAESLIDGIGGEQSLIGKRNLKMIATSGTRLASLVNDILDFSKLRNNKIGLTKTPLHLKYNIDLILTLSQPLVEKKEIDLINNIPENIPFVEADENRLQQIMLNIIGNAVKFTDAGQVSINCQLAINNDEQPKIIGNKKIVNNSIVISIRDTGIGIPEHLYEKIFETFEQGDGSTDRTYGGTGIGLSVTKQLIELHGGEIWVESEVGKGSVFYFTLPMDINKLEAGFEEDAINFIQDQTIHKLEQDKSELEENTESVPIIHSEEGKLTSAKDGEGFNILVVDDESVNLQVLENQLSLQNFKPTLAENGKEALKLLKENKHFDLVLLDIMMPQMSGYEVCQELRKEFPAEQLPVIMLTAKNQVTDLVNAFDAGANDYLTKPFAKIELFARINSHLDLKTANLKLDEYNKNLELKVEERTHEIQEQNVILGQQKVEIQFKNEDLKQRNEEIIAQAERLSEINTELEKLSIVASETDNAIVIMNPQTEFEWINEGFTKLYGFTLDELKDKYNNLFTVSSNPEINQTIQNCINDKVSFVYESVTDTASGKQVWVQTTLTPILDPTGNIHKIVAIDTDIRKLKKIEKELEHKNEHITDSIRYAKTIQTAILPFKTVIDNHFESFMLFLPKDIVSGDFYWYVEAGGYHFIAVADCTGHGVPGAFMSMIGSSLLNQIVHHENEYSTANILTRLHTLIVSSLRQEKSDNNDGMDVCLCRIEKTSEKTSKIQFTGAKRPLIVIEKGASKPQMYKSDRKSIGGTQKKRNDIHYTSQNLILSTGDLIYLSSDGFIDQNNANRQKYGTQRLLDTLLLNSNKSVNEQHENLNNEIVKWMEGTNQRDDIAVLGLKM